MRPVVRINDINQAGGAVTNAHANVLANGRPLAKKTSPVTPHPPCSPLDPIHCVATSGTPGSIKVLANGIALLRVGDRDTCGHSRATGSRNVFVG
tara:strand:+ start:457 stop:741 length:285 start_codon:yes stop_codon:yes gene_type:complete